MNSHQSKTGSAILGVLILVILLSAAGGAYLRVSLTEYRQSYRNVYLQSAINVAEAATEEAIYAMRRDDWSGWQTLAPNVYYRQMPTYLYFNNRDRGFAVADLRTANRPSVYAQGSVDSKHGWISKQLHMELGRRSLFANGLTARNTVRFSGNNVKVDSYDSRKGAYDPLFNRNDRGSVGSIAVTVDAVNIQNADVLGFVATGGAMPQVGANGSILGFDSPAGAKIDPSRVTRDFYADLPPVDEPQISGAPHSNAPAWILGDPVNPNQKQSYKLQNLNIKNNETLQIAGHVVIVVEGNVDIKGTLEVLPTGRVELYVRGNMDVGGNGLVNNSNTPDRMQIYGTGTVPNEKEFKLHGNAAMYAAVYAPNAFLSLRGGGHSGTLFGAAVAYDIFINGNYQFHYDEALADFSNERSFRIDRWRELVGADERIDFSVTGNILGQLDN